MESRRADDVPDEEMDGLARFVASRRLRVTMLEADRLEARYTGWSADVWIALSIVFALASLATFFSVWLAARVVTGRMWPTKVAHWVGIVACGWVTVRAGRMTWRFLKELGNGAALLVDASSVRLIVKAASRQRTITWERGALCFALGVRHARSTAENPKWQVKLVFEHHGRPVEIPLCCPRNEEQFDSLLNRLRSIAPVRRLSEPDT